MVETRSIGLWLLCSLVCALPLLGAPEASEVELAERLIEFRLEDQFGHTFTDESWPGLGLVFIAGDRVGSRYTRVWGEALRQALTERRRDADYRLVGLSHLASVPRFLRRTIRKRFPQEADQWVLLDWEGVFEQAYGFEKESCNLLAFSPEGTLLLHRGVRELDTRALDEILRVLAPATEEPE